MAHNVEIHQAQTLILRELLFRPDASFTELRGPTGLESDHFKFHIAKLVEMGYVSKTDQGRYALTNEGKEHANKLDTDNNSIERQPKSAVLLLIEKEGKYLIQQRLKHPYFGYWGLPSGKIRWGETIHHTASRELKEETGLQADTEFLGIYHEHASSDVGKLLEDKIFFIMKCTNVQGELLEEFEGGKNYYMTVEETKMLEKRYHSFDFELKFAIDGYGKARNEVLVEKHQVYSSDEF